MYASMEWAIPGLISAYILKPYFEAFLQEAGKDHYIILKNWVKKIVTRFKELPVETLAASQSTEKVINTDNIQSKAITIHIQCKGHFFIKLLFDNKIGTTEVELCIDDIMDMVLAHYLNEPNSLSAFLDNQRLRGGEIFAIIDPATNKWKFLGVDEVIKMIKSK
jgi:hypothetical protein